MSTQTGEVLTDSVVQRVKGEFFEMHGLCLTAPQAQRLWGLDAPTCLALIEFLVETRFLHRTERGMYARLADGARELRWPLAQTATGHTSVLHVSEVL
jgi:hypothetical protein